MAGIIIDAGNGSDPTVSPTVSQGEWTLTDPELMELFDAQDQSVLEFTTSESTAQFTVSGFDVKEILSPHASVTGLNILTRINQIGQVLGATPEIWFTSSLGISNKNSSVDSEMVQDNKAQFLQDLDTTDDWGINSTLGFDLVEFLRDDDFGVVMKFGHIAGQATDVEIEGVAIVIWGTNLTTGRSFLPQRGAT